MQTGQPWMGSWPPSPLVMLAGVLVAMVFMYLGRPAAHAAFRALSAALQRAFVELAEAMMSVHRRLVERNREVLLEMGRESAERMIEREFERVNDVVARDIGSYPELHREISHHIAQIEEDYRAASEVPPPPPEWASAVQAVASIPSQGDPVVGRILGDIHKTLCSAEKTAITEYREASRERHRRLSRMLPFWRKLTKTMDQVGATIRGLQERSSTIDRQMEVYEEIRAKSDVAVQRLSASSMTHFVASGLVLVIALLGGFINFHLIALPMSEMVGATSYVGPVKTSDIAALVIILTEVAMGLFLMESIRITRLFPVIGMLEDQTRRKMIWISFGILLVLALVEGSLAFMRDLLASDREALAQTLAGVAATGVQFRWIPSIGQIIMGLLLPFALAFAAIPLESFIQSSRIVLGSFMAGGLRGLSGAFKILGNFFEALALMLIHVYDFVIIVPLRLEQVLQKKNGVGTAVADQAATGGGLGR